MVLSDRDEQIQEAAAITLQPQPKKNSKRPIPLGLQFHAQPVRQHVETTFSQIMRPFPRHLNAVTKKGFVLKINCFLLVFAVQCLTR